MKEKLNILVIFIAIFCMILSAQGGVRKMTREEKDQASIRKAVMTLKQLESFSAVPYCCRAGVYTIGYGFTDQNLVSKGVISRTEADTVLNFKCTELMTFLRSKITRELMTHQYAALISFTYNVGSNAFAKSELLKKINSGASNLEIVQQIRRWDKVDGKVNKGLSNRRGAEVKLFMNIR